jgi:hypothetical protein
MSLACTRAQKRNGHEIPHVRLIAVELGFRADRRAKCSSIYRREGAEISS